MILLIVIFLVIVYLVCWWLIKRGDTPSSHPSQIVRFSAPSNPNQKYFGYYLGQDVPQKFSDYCNCSIIYITAEDYPSIKTIQDAINYHVKYLLIFKKLGMKGILNMSLLIDHWAQYWAGIYPYLDNILAFYLDEPPQDKINSLSAMRGDVDAVKDKYDIHILTVHTPSQIVAIKYGQYNIPDTVDWIGFDDYSCFDNATVCGQFIGYPPPDYRGYNISIPEKTKLLVDTYPDKKIMFVPGGVTKPNFYDFTEEELIVRNYKFLELCQNTPNSVGMIVYSYGSFSSYGESGVDQKPKLEAQLRNIGLCLTGRDPSKCSDLITCLPNNAVDDSSHCQSNSTCCSGKCDFANCDSHFKNCKCV